MPSALAADRPDPPRLDRPGRLPRRGADATSADARRAGDARAPGRDAPDRVHRPRLHHRLGVEGVPRAPGRCTARALPAGLLESDRLPEPVFTPSTKAAEGHDENISFERGGRARRRRARRPGPGDRPRRLPRAAPTPPLERGIVIADTKFELGIIDGELAICDEILTPDSSPLLAGRARGSRARRRPRSTSSPSATGPSRPAGTRSRRRRRCPTR